MNKGAWWDTGEARWKEVSRAQGYVLERLQRKYVNFDEDAWRWEDVVVYRDLHNRDYVVYEERVRAA